MEFMNMGIKPEIVNALWDYDIKEPTPIQEQSVPAGAKGQDVVGISKTGSGKTAAFGIPVLERTVKGDGIQSLILAPTRELALQICEEMQKFGKYLDLNYAIIFGGVAYGPQMDAMKKAEVVVGTPGRVLDHLERGTLDISSIRSFVLDEADKMVDMGFIEDVERILEFAPDDRQVLLFGATISNEIDYLRNQYMSNPIVAEAEVQVSDDFLEQYYYDVDRHMKFSTLVHVLQQEDTKSVIVFCSTRRTVDIVTHNLKRQNIKCQAIHGKLSQNNRLKVIKSFNEGKTQVLVASAVAARGLHIDNVSHVINYDLPQDPEEYIHRVGRTARAGETGKAITLLENRDHNNFQAILSRYGLDVENIVAKDVKRVPFDANAGGGRNRGKGRGRGRGGPRGRPRGRRGKARN